jgi:hypothetical protein
VFVQHILPSLVLVLTSPVFPLSLGRDMVVVDRMVDYR